MIKQVFTVPVPVLVPVKAGTNKAIRSAFLISVSSWLLKHSSSASWLVEECHYLRPHRLWCKTTNWRAVVVAAGPTAIHLMHRGPIPSVYPLPRRGGGVIWGGGRAAACWSWVLAGFVAAFKESTDGHVDLRQTCLISPHFLAAWMSVMSITIYVTAAWSYTYLHNY